MPKPGDLIDGLFKLNRELGQGAAGRVFQAALERDWTIASVGTEYGPIHLTAGTNVAIKFFKAEIFEREAFSAGVVRRIQEGRTGSTVRHTNLVQI